jgi:hypothetical protein
MTGALRKNVNPKLVAVIIIAVLAAVQWVWWKGLVAKKPLTPPGRPSQPLPPSSRGPSNAIGWTTALVDTYVGSTQPGDADGPAHAARFDGPAGIATERGGALLVADSRNHRIRRVSNDAVTATVAGSSPGFRDGPLQTALFNTPAGIRAEIDGSFLILDLGNSRIRRLTDTAVSTVKVLPNPEAAERAFRPPLRLQPTTILGFDQGPAVPQTEIPLNNLFTGVEAGGRTICVDMRHNAVLMRKGTSVSVIAGICSVAFRGDNYRDGSGDRARFGRIGGVAVSGSDVIFVADTGNNCIRRITLEGGDEV